MKKNLGFALAAALLGCGAPPSATSVPAGDVASSAQAVVVPLTPDQDTWFHGGGLGPVDYGQSCELEVGDAGVPGNGKGLLHFVISPALCMNYMANPARTAVLQLRAANQNGPGVVNIHQVMGPWIPGLSGGLGGPGAAGCTPCALDSGLSAPFAPPPFAAVPTAAIPVAAPPLCANYAANLKTLVDGWCTGVPNFGVMLRGAPGAAPVNFHSRDIGGPAQPTLVLTF